jgi:hypothetical protein
MTALFGPSPERMKMGGLDGFVTLEVDPANLRPVTRGVYTDEGIAADINLLESGRPCK